MISGTSGPTLPRKSRRPAARRRPDPADDAGERRGAVPWPGSLSPTTYQPLAAKISASARIEYGESVKPCSNSTAPFGCATGISKLKFQFGVWPRASARLPAE